MYIEVTNDLTKRGKFILAKNLKKFIVDGNELYRSYFGYDDDIVGHLKMGRKTAQGFVGKFFLNQIIIDIDKKADMRFDDLVHKMRTIVDKLIKDFDLEDQFQVWFSGTGFHIHIPNIFGFKPTKDLPRIVRETIITHLPEADPKPIHPRGLIRVGGTINLKSSLYKIPLREEEIWFLNEQELYQWASENRKVDLVRPKGWKTFPELIVIPAESNTDTTIKVVRPSRVVTCMQNVLALGPVAGTRHERLLRVVSWMKRNGMPPKSAMAVVNDYVGKREYEFVKLVNDVYSKDYEYGCNDLIMGQFCSDSCIFSEKRNYLPEISSANDIEKSFAAYVQSGWKKNSINLAPILGIDKALDKTPIKEWWVQPEDVVGLIGGTGMNKTALMQNIGAQLKEFSPLLYISTEFSNNLLGRRFAQITHNMELADVMQYYEDGRYQEQALSDAFTHIKFTNATPTFQELEDLIKKYKPRVLMIDVIDDIISKNKRNTEGESEVGQGIKDLGRKYKHFTFYVHHITKSAAFDDRGNPKELNIHSGKGSSTIDQKSDVVLGIEGRADDPYRTVRSLKGRDNPPFRVGYKVNMGTFRFVKDVKAEEILDKINKPKLSKGK